MDRRHALKIMEEIHKGICGNHVGSRALATKILRARYFWATMKQDCMKFVRKCEKCQRFGESKHMPSEQLHCSESTWPFHKWGIDILGPFPLGPG